jgi:uncharacterized hydrophobic protein (TIGR00271 family)
MRLIQVHVPSSVHSSVRERLDAEGVEYLIADESGGRQGFIAYIPVPSGAVDPVLELLYDAGLPESSLTIVSEATRANVEQFDHLNERFVENPKGDAGISYPQLRERADDLKPERYTYLAFAALSAIVAVGGLLLNSAIIIVGAMVIAPFAGSTLSASVGWVLGDRDMITDSAVSQSIGLVIAYVGAVLMSLMLQQSGFVPASIVVGRIDQVSAFLTPNLLTLAIAIAAGLAGALALATDLPVSIAGVAVAAAIVPAAATAGIGTVWGEPLIVVGAIVLLLMNIVFINVAAYVALVVLGYRSSVIRGLSGSIGANLRTGVYGVVVVLFLAMVVATSFATYQHVAYERDVNQAVQTVMEDGDYEELELVSVATEYNDMNLLTRSESVTVTVSRSDDELYTEFAEEIRQRIEQNTGRSITVNVRFIDYQQASSSESQEMADPSTSARTRASFGGPVRSAAL